MATKNSADRVATTAKTLEWIQEHRAQLTAKGLNVDYWVASLQAALDAALAADQVQEGMKAGLKNATVAWKQSDRQMYLLASAAIDAVGAAHGKDSPEAEVVRRFRSKLHQPVEDEEAQPGVEPAPAA